MSETLPDNSVETALDAADAPAAALMLARGLGRMFAAQGQASLAEFTLDGGRRADLIALDAKGRFTLVEIKTSRADFRADAKWPDYLNYCDFFYFAAPAGFPMDILPNAHGLMTADAYGGAILRPAEETKLHAVRRKALTLRFARQAARRVTALTDPVQGGVRAF